MQEHHYFKFTYQTELNNLDKAFSVFDFSGRENSFFSGFWANVAKQAIIYCEFNCQTGETTNKKICGASTSRSAR